MQPTSPEANIISRLQMRPGTPWVIWNSLVSRL
jgi:hypothetical protein